MSSSTLYPWVLILWSLGIISSKALWRSDCFRSGPGNWQDNPGISYHIRKEESISDHWVCVKGIRIQSEERPIRQRWESLIFRKNNNFKEIMHIKYLTIHEFKMILNRKTITDHCCLMLRNKFTALKLEKDLTFVLFFLYELYWRVII